MASYQAVLLDVDGTLVDSNEAHARAWVEVIREAGFEVAHWQVRRLIGMGGDLLLRHLLELPVDGDESEELRARRKHRFAERYLAEVRPIAGAAELVERLDSAGVATVVATSSSKDDLEGLLARGGLESLLERAVDADDADRAKPCPDVIAAACEKAGVSPSQAVLVGDTPFDQEAARRAGAGFVAVATGGWCRADFGGAPFLPSVAALLDPAVATMGDGRLRLERNRDRLEG